MHLAGQDDPLAAGVVTGAGTGYHEAPVGGGAADQGGTPGVDQGRQGSRRGQKFAMVA